MILDDKWVVLRTRDRPELLLRLEELVRSYGHADRPGLVVQARPATEAKLGMVDVDDEAFQRRFLSPDREGMTLGGMVFNRPSERSLRSTESPVCPFGLNRPGYAKCTATDTSSPDYGSFRTYPIRKARPCP